MGAAQLQGLSGKIVADGGWQDGSGIAAPMTVTVEGIVAGDLVQVRVTNRLAKPGTTDDGLPYGADVSVDGIVKILEPYRWIKVKRTAIAGSPGTVAVCIFGHRPPAS